MFVDWRRWSIADRHNLRKLIKFEVAVTHLEFSTTFGQAQVLSFLVPYYLSLEFHRKYATLQLLFLDDFQCAMLLVRFHDFSVTVHPQAGEGA